MDQYVDGMRWLTCRVMEAEDEVTPLRLARIDAARGIGERIEYEVPADPAGWLPAPIPTADILIHTPTHCEQDTMRCCSVKCVILPRHGMLAALLQTFWLSGTTC